MCIDISSEGDGNGDGDSSDDADSANSDASDSDASVTISGRGRASAPDRRLGSGSVAKREKVDPVPVSPPRQSVIAAAHEAEEGSQIKVKFDSGQWYGGTILEVDSQRCVCVIGGGLVYLLSFLQHTLKYYVRRAS